MILCILFTSIFLFTTLDLYLNSWQDFPVYFEGRFPFPLLRVTFLSLILSKHVSHFGFSAGAQPVASASSAHKIFKSWRVEKCLKHWRKMTYLGMIGLSQEKLNVVCLLLSLWLIKSKSFQMYCSANFSTSIPYRVLSGALSKFEAFEVFEACKMGLCTPMAGPSRKERWATEIANGLLRNVWSRWDTLGDIYGIGSHNEFPFDSFIFVWLWGI